MRKGLLIAFLLFCLLLTVLPMSLAAESLAAPSVTVPSGWSLYSQMAYPTGGGAIHDPQGCGWAAYRSSWYTLPDTMYPSHFYAVQDWVYIWYEDAMGASYSAAQLQSEAETIAPTHEPYYYTEFFSPPAIESGVTTYAGVPAGFVKYYNSSANFYALQLALVKNGYYINIYTWYAQGNETVTNSILNSLSVPETTPTPTPTYSLAPPTITVPAGWGLTNQVAYPGFSAGAHDPRGCGLVSYNGSTYYLLFENATMEVGGPDEVYIFYEDSLGISYSDAQLQDEAELIAPGPYQFYQYAKTAFDSSGVTIYAGIRAGYATAYNTTYGFYLLHVIMIAGDYYIDILADYVNSTGQADVNFIINSISVPPPTATPTPTLPPSPTPTPAPIPSPTPTPTPTATPTPSPTAIPSPTPTATPTPTSSPAPTSIPTTAPTPTPTPTRTPTPTPFSSTTPTPTTTGAPSPSGSATPAPTFTSTSPAPTVSPSLSPGQEDWSSVNASQLLSTPWVPPPPNAAVATAVTAVAVGASSVAVAAAVTPVGVPTGRVTKEVKELLPSSVKKWLAKYMASRRKLSVVERTGSPFVPKKSETIAYCVSVAALASAFSYVKANSLVEFVAVLPTILATSVFVDVVKTFVLIAYSRRHGVWTEHKLWYFGLATFLISTFAFRVPFSSPSRSVHYSAKFTARMGAILASASIVITLVFAGFFYALLVCGFATLSTTGLAMCIIGAFFDTFPVAPMNGRVIYNYKKSLWAVLFAATLILYIAWLLLL